MPSSDFNSSIQSAPTSLPAPVDQLKAVANKKWYNRLVVNENTKQLEQKLFLTVWSDRFNRWRNGAPSLTNSQLIKLKALQLVKSLDKNWISNSSTVSLVKALAKHTGLSNDKKPSSLDSVIQVAASKALDEQVPLINRTIDILIADYKDLLSNRYSPALLDVQERTKNAALGALSPPKGTEQQPIDDHKIDQEANERDSFGKDDWQDDGLQDSGANLAQGGAQAFSGSDEQDDSFSQGDLSDEAPLAKGDEQAFPSGPAEINLPEPHASKPSVTVSVVAESDVPTQKTPKIPLLNHDVKLVDPKQTDRWQLPKLSSIIRAAGWILLGMGGLGLYASRGGSSSSPSSAGSDLTTRIPTPSPLTKTPIGIPGFLLPDVSLNPHLDPDLPEHLYLSGRSVRLITGSRIPKEWQNAITANEEDVRLKDVRLDEESGEKIAEANVASSSATTATPVASSARTTNPAQTVDEQASLIDRFINGLLPLVAFGVAAVNISKLWSGGAQKNAQLRGDVLASQLGEQITANKSALDDRLVKSGYSAIAQLLSKDEIAKDGVDAYYKLIGQDQTPLTPGESPQVFHTILSLETILKRRAAVLDVPAIEAALEQNRLDWLAAASPSFPHIAIPVIQKMLELTGGRFPLAFVETIRAEVQGGNSHKQQQVLEIFEGYLDLLEAAKNSDSQADFDKARAYLSGINKQLSPIRNASSNAFGGVWVLSAGGTPPIHDAFMKAIKIQSAVKAPVAQMSSVPSSAFAVLAQGYKERMATIEDLKIVADDQVKKQLVWIHGLFSAWLKKAYTGGNPGGLVGQSKTLNYKTLLSNVMKDGIKLALNQQINVKELSKWAAGEVERIAVKEKADMAVAWEKDKIEGFQRRVKDQIESVLDGLGLISIEESKGKHLPDDQIRESLSLSKKAPIRRLALQRYVSTLIQAIGAQKDVETNVRLLERIRARYEDPTLGLELIPAYEEFVEKHYLHIRLQEQAEHAANQIAKAAITIGKDIQKIDTAVEKKTPITQEIKDSLEKNRNQAFRAVRSVPFKLKDLVQKTADLQNRDETFRKQVEDLEIRLACYIQQATTLPAYLETKLKQWTQPPDPNNKEENYPWPAQLTAADGEDFRNMWIILLARATYSPEASFAATLTLNKLQYEILNKFDKVLPDPQQDPRVQLMNKDGDWALQERNWPVDGKLQKVQLWGQKPDATLASKDWLANDRYGELSSSRLAFLVEISQLHTLLSDPGVQALCTTDEQKEAIAAHARDLGKLVDYELLLRREIKTLERTAGSADEFCQRLQSLLCVGVGKDYSSLLKNMCMKSHPIGEIFKSILENEKLNEYRKGLDPVKDATVLQLWGGRSLASSTVHSTYAFQRMTRNNMLIRNFAGLDLKDDQHKVLPQQEMDVLRVISKLYLNSAADAEEVGGLIKGISDAIKENKGWLNLGQSQALKELNAFVLNPRPHALVLVRKYFPSDSPMLKKLNELEMKLLQYAKEAANFTSQGTRGAAPGSDERKAGVQDDEVKETFTRPSGSDDGGPAGTLFQSPLLVDSEVLKEQKMVQDDIVRQLEKWGSAVYDKQELARAGVVNLIKDLPYVIQMNQFKELLWNVVVHLDNLDLLLDLPDVYGNDPELTPLLMAAIAFKGPGELPRDEFHSYLHSQLQALSPSSAFGRMRQIVYEEMGEEIKNPSSYTSRAYELMQQAKEIGGACPGLSDAHRTSPRLGSGDGLPPFDGGGVAHFPLVEDSDGDLIDDEGQADTLESPAPPAPPGTTVVVGGRAPRPPAPPS